MRMLEIKNVGDSTANQEPVNLLKGSISQLTYFKTLKVYRVTNESHDCGERPIIYV